MTPVAINVLEAMRLKDVRDGAGDEVQSGMREHLAAHGLMRLTEGGYALTELGEASLNAFVPRRQP